MGGPDGFVQMLDSVFNVPPLFDDSYYGGTIHEIREMTVMNMGNYAHGNQPVQHMILPLRLCRPTAVEGAVLAPRGDEPFVQQPGGRLLRETRITGKLRLGMSFPPSVFIRSVRVPTSM